MISCVDGPPAPATDVCNFFDKAQQQCVGLIVRHACCGNLHRSPTAPLHTLTTHPSGLPGHVETRWAPSTSSTTRSLRQRGQPPWAAALTTPAATAAAHMAAATPVPAVTPAVTTPAVTPSGAVSALTPRAAGAAAARREGGPGLRSGGGPAARWLLCQGRFLRPPSPRRSRRRGSPGPAARGIRPGMRWPGGHSSSFKQAACRPWAAREKLAQPVTA